MYYALDNDCDPQEILREMERSVRAPATTGVLPCTVNRVTSLIQLSSGLLITYVCLIPSLAGLSPQTTLASGPSTSKHFPFSSRIHLKDEDVGFIDCVARIRFL
jgi:hypothetical protein